jgi:hypothetical protein
MTTNKLALTALPRERVKSAFSPPAFFARATLAQRFCKTAPAFRFEIALKPAKNAPIYRYRPAHTPRCLSPKRQSSPVR